jgi:aspartate aminotransferase-like enzyme
MRFEGPSLSSSLVVAELPPGETFDHLYEAMRKRGFIIYATKGPLQKSTFIVANMGCLEPSMIEAFLATLTEVRGANGRAFAQV